MIAATSSPLVARSAELKLLHQLLSPEPPGPRAVLLTGEAGIGKTALWRHAVDRGREHGAVVLTARPAEDEMLGALVGLGDLVDHSKIGADVLRPGLDLFARGRGLLAALQELAQTSTVIIAIDDLQWLDADSSRVLRYVFRRLEHESIRLLVTWRIEPDSRPPTVPLSFPHDLAQTRHVGPLSLAELRRLLALQWNSVSPLTLRSIHAASNGNPLYAIEVARTLSPGQRRTGISASGPLPRSLGGVIENRLAEVDDDLRPLIELVAVAGRVTLSQIEEHLPTHEVGELLIEARNQGLIATDEAHRIYLAHPLLSSGVEQAMNPIGRRQLHLNLAEGADDPLVRARHMALATDEADAAVADELEEAARTARAAGTPAVAVEFARHSGRVTPPDDADGVQRRTLLEAESRAAAGDASGACSLYDDVVARSPPGPERARALLQRFYVENDDLELGDALLRQAVADAEADPVLHGEATDTLAWYRGVFAGDITGGITTGCQAVERLQDAGNELRHRWAQGHLVHMETLAGRPDIPRMASLADYFDEHGPPNLGGGPRAWLTKQLLFNGDLDGARREMNRVLVDYDRRGFVIGLPYRYYDLALLEIAAGNLAEALEWSRTGITLARDAESPDIEGWLLYPLSLAQSWLGDTDAARESAKQLMARPGRAGGSALGELRARSALGVTELGCGNAEAAVEALAPAVELADRIGLAHPGFIPVLPDAAVANAACGHQAEAARLADRLDQQAAQLGLERIIAMADLVRGAVELADGNCDAARDRLRAAQDRFERLGMGPDAARGTLLLGRAELRAGRRSEAVACFTEAMARFDAIGAPGWSGLARTAMDRADRGRSDGRLTDAEARIAELISLGRTNKEVAAALFVSVSTVEAHLTRLYRKLGIRSRTELSALVHEGSLDVTNEGSA